MPDESEAKTLKLTFPIEKGTNRAVVPVSGAFGAINSTGQLIMHFYVEYPEMPVSAIQTVEEESGKPLSEVLDIENPQNFTREVVATLSIPLVIIPGLANFLNQQIKQFVANTKTSEEK